MYFVLSFTMAYIWHIYIIVYILYSLHSPHLTPLWFPQVRVLQGWWSNSHCLTMALPQVYLIGALSTHRKVRMEKISWCGERTRIGLVTETNVSILAHQSVVLLVLQIGASHLVSGRMPPSGIISQCVF